MEEKHLRTAYIAGIATVIALTLCPRSLRRDIEHCFKHTTNDLVTTITNSTETFRGKLYTDRRNENLREQLGILSFSPGYGLKQATNNYPSGVSTNEMKVPRIKNYDFNRGQTNGMERTFN